MNHNNLVSQTYLPSFRLDGRVAIVTGANQGLGRHIALAMGEAGANLALVARRKEPLEDVANIARKMGRDVVCITADLSNLLDIRKMITLVVEHFGEVNILVNNAGINIQELATDVSEESWDAIMGINLKGAFFTAREVGLQFIKQGTGGRIINMASQMAEVGFFKRSAYCSSKAGVVAFTKVLALEWAEHRIRVNAVSPTFIESPLTRKIFEDRQIADEILRRLPLRRLGTMEEVAAAFVYLASDGADLVNGHNLLVDGGWTAQ